MRGLVIIFRLCAFFDYQNVSSLSARFYFQREQSNVLKLCCLSMICSYPLRRCFCWLTQKWDRLFGRNWKIWILHLQEHFESRNTLLSHHAEALIASDKEIFFWGNASTVCTDSVWLFVCGSNPTNKRKKRLQGTDVRSPYQLTSPDSRVFSKWLASYNG